jgi:two-component system LytT family response regulator
MSMSDEGFCVVIADDEPLARRTLRDFLSDVLWIAEIREAADGATAIQLVDAWQPDLVFLDVVMPSASGLQVIQQISHHPYVILTTAFDQYAVTAFELGALDYVLKPFSKERIRMALERVRALLRAERGAVVERARTVLGGERCLTRVFARDGNRIVNIDLARVERVEGADDHAILHHGGRRNYVKVRLHELEVMLDPTRFARIHRSHIVNLDFVVACEPYDAWRLQAIMRNGDRIVASRTGTRLLRSLVVG